MGLDFSGLNTGDMVFLPQTSNFTSGSSLGMTTASCLPQPPGPNEYHWLDLELESEQQYWEKGPSE